MAIGLKAPSDWGYTPGGVAGGSGTMLTPSITNNTIGSSQSAATAFSTYGPWIAAFGAINSAVGSYYQAKTMQYQLESQSSAMKFQQDVSAINARQAEFQAQRILEAGERAIGVSTMRYGKVKGASRASMAARGIQLGEGSAAEVEATTDIMKEIDSLTINANAVRSAEAARTQAANYTVQGMMQGVSAENLSMSAGTISPFGAASTSLLGSASSFATTMYRDKMLDRLLAAQG